MKNRMIKVITLVLSCLLLIGAAVGITVSAEEGAPETTVEIVKKNIAYEGAIQVVYLVDAKNIPEGATVGISFDGSFKEYAHMFTLGEAEYYAVYSDGIVADEYRKAFGATAALMDAEGNVTTYGEAVTLTPYDYAMARFDLEPSKNQLNLYKALLDYGAAVQAVLCTEEEIAANGGWIDEYYFYTFNGEEYALRGIEFNGVLTANRFEDGKILYGWTNEADELIPGFTTFNVRPGHSIFNTKYVVADASLETFEEGRGDVQTTAKPVDEMGENPNGAYYIVDGGVFTFEQANNKGVADKVKIIPANADVYAKRYVFEVDFNLQSWNMPSNTWIHKFCMWGESDIWEIFNATCQKNGADTFKIGGATLKLDTWNNLKMIAEVQDDGSLATYVIVNGITVEAGTSDSVKKYGNYRMVSAGLGMRNNAAADVCDDSVMMLDNMLCYAEGDAASYEVALDTNGADELDPYTVIMGEEYELPTPTGASTPFLGWYDGDTKIESTGIWTYFGAAPTLVAKYASVVNVTLEAAGAELESDTIELYAGMEYTLPTPSIEGFIFGGWVDENGNNYGVKGTSFAAESDITLKALWSIELAGNTYTFDTANQAGFGIGSTAAGKVENGKFIINNTTWNPQVYFAMAPDSHPYVGNAAGNVYVFEMDFKYVGGAIASSAGNEPAYIGFQNASNFDKYNGSQYSNGEFLKPTTAASAEGDAAGVIMYGVTFNKGETYKIRFEHVVGNDKYVNVYVDGTLVRTHQYNSILATADPTQVVGFQFTFRKVGNFEFDNVYCGIHAPAVETSFTLDPTYGALAEGEDKTYTYMTGAPYTLPTPTLEGLVFAGWFNGDAPVATSGVWNAGEITSGVLTAKWVVASKHSTDFSDNTIPSWITGGGMTASDGELKFVYNSGGIHIKPTATVMDAPIGTRYVLEMDFAIDTVSAENIGLAFIGFSHTSATWEGGTSLWSYLDCTTGGSIGFYGNYVPVGSTNTLRFEFVVRSANTGDLYVYVNGNSGISIASSKTGLDVADFYHFNIQWRGAADGKNLAGTIDNLTVSVEYPAEEANISLNANGGTLPEGASDNITALSGAVCNLPVPTREGYEFAGWYYGDALIPAGGIMPYSGDVALKAKWFEVTTKTVGDANISANTWKVTKLENAATKVTVPAGSVFEITSKYTFMGLSNCAINVETGEVTNLNKDMNYGFPRIHGFTAGSNDPILIADGTIKPVVTSTIVTADGKVAVDEYGCLLEEYKDLTASDLFYSQVSWSGFTFDFGKTYELKWTIVINDGAKPTITLSVTDENKVTVTKDIATNNTVIVGFARIHIEHRSASTTDPSYADYYVLNHSFVTNLITTKTVAPDVE